MHTAWLLLVGLLCLCVLSPVHAATYVVETSDDEIVTNERCSLREAVRVASGLENNDCGLVNANTPHTIQIDTAVISTIYLLLDGADGEDNSRHGDLDIGADMTIRGLNGRARIDGLARSRVFEIHNDATVSFENLEITNGHTVSGDSAGAITNSGAGAVTIRNCKFSDNRAEHSGSLNTAGAVFANGGFVTVADSTFERNEALTFVESAGAIWGGRSIVVTSTKFEGNRCNGTTCGGAIGHLDHGVVNIEGGSFVDNRGGQGGAIYSGTGAVSLLGTELRDNVALDAGGAIWALGRVTIDGGAAYARVSGNTAFGGDGGIVYSADSVHFRRVGGITYNEAGGNGGAASANYDVSFESIQGDVASNRAGGYGGVAYSRYASVEFYDVTGSVRENVGVNGAVAYSSDSSYIRSVGGSITGNKATNSGGVLMVLRPDTDTVIENVAGEISYNTAGASGGVVFMVSDGLLEITNVGSIHHNGASGLGGVVHGQLGGVSISQVHGDVANNYAGFDGGVVYSYLGDAVSIRYVDGSVRSNVALIGGVVASFSGSNGLVDIGYIGGSIEFNVAVYAGGVVATRSDTQLHDIGGDVSNNRLSTAEEFDSVYFEYSYLPGFYDSRYIVIAELEGTGGVIFAGADVDVWNIKGDIADNSALAAGGGGFVFSLGSVSIRGVEGSILRNQSFGSAVYAPNGDVRVSDVGGDISYNTSPVFLAGAYDNVLTVEYVGGDLVGNTCDLPYFQYYAYYVPVYDYYSQSILLQSAGIATGGYVAISHVGDIAYNHCVNGGVLYSTYAASITYAGDIHHNSADWGGVISSFGFARLENAGVIANNWAIFDGGAIWAGDAAKIVNVGDIEHNHALGSGGVVRTFGGGLQVDGTGSIRNNSAGAGGVFSVVYGSADVRNVNGDISHNSANWYGGVFYVRESYASHELADVSGDISYNSARGGGVFAVFGYAAYVRVSHTGALRYNTANADGGGVVFGQTRSDLGASLVMEYVGAIEHNSAEGFGGVAFIDGHIDLLYVNGGVSYNSSFQGGVFDAMEIVHVENVFGDVNYNTSVQSVFSSRGPVGIQGVYGDVIGNLSGGSGALASGYAVTVDFVSGSIRRNSAVADGGVIHSLNSSTRLTNVGGDIVGNTAQFGGVIYSSAAAELTDVAGEVRNNRALFGSGGVVYAVLSSRVLRVGGVRYNSASGFRVSGGAFYAHNLLLSDVYGDIEGNVAGNYGAAASGGVAFGSSSVRVTNVHGSIRGNLAQRYGGAFASFGQVEVSDVQGDIALNTARLSGGAIYSGYAVIRNVSGDLRGNTVSILEYNTSGAGGGVAYAQGTLEVSDVGGSITDNSVFQYGGGGGAFFAGQSAVLLRIGGDISYNRVVGAGGAVFANDAMQVSGVGGSIGWNRAQGNGGAFFSNSSVALSNVAGSIVHNGGENGGVVFSAGLATVQNIGGHVSWNKANQGGGVLFSESSELSNIGGSISGNRAGGLGGVVNSSSGSVVIENVEGAVEENVALSGGVVYAGDASRVSLANVTGRISRNEAQSYPSYGMGGVIYVNSTGASTVAVESVGEISNNYASANGGFASVVATQFTVRSVNGSIHRNNAGYYGGVMAGEVQDLSVEDVRGDIRENAAGSGGAIYNLRSNSRVEVRDVAGSINKNRAVYYAGGFIMSTGSVLVDGVTGNVSSNSASSHGGVAFTNGAITLQNVSGDVTYNTAAFGGALFSYQSVNIQNIGSFIGNYGHGDSAGQSGAVVGGYIVMQDVHGDISYNVGGLRSLDSLVLQRVDGNIHHNRAYSGGVAFANTSLEVFDVNGSICDNFATLYGGAFNGVYVHVANVAGDICNNTSGYAGGFLYAFGSADVSSVSGSLLFNQSPFTGGFASVDTGLAIKDIGGHIEGSQSQYGGFVFATNGDIEIDTIGGGIVDCSAYRGGFAMANGLQLSNLGGSIDRCVATEEGGFAYLRPVRQVRVTLNGIYGSITNCSASNGAVMHVSTMTSVEVDITNVTGDVSNNYSFGFNSIGSVVSAVCDYANVSIENVGGSITNNQAAYGGVIGLEGTGGHVVIRNVSGLVSNNRAFYGDGGVIFAPNFLGELTAVEEGVCDNSAYADGGVMLVYSGTVTTFNDGPIQFNSAYGDGGVIHSFGDALVDAGNGVVLGNTPNVVASANGGAENVQGSLVVDGVHTDALRIVSQPSDGVENVPLPGQPSLEVAGAMDGHELPIRVVVIHQDGSEDELTTDFNIAFEDRVHFQDLAIPFVENNLQLRFELIITRCDHIEETVVSNVTSTFFNVTECEFPAPAVCPDDVTVDNKQHECSAFVALPAAFSRKCSQPLISHTTTPLLEADRAVGEYPVGTTFVTYTLANSLGVEDTCDVRVVVHDTEAPVITCPAAAVVESDAGQCGATVTLSSATATDNCDPDLLVITSTHPGTFYPVGVTEVTFRATDLSGNFAECSVEVQVVDAELPTIACPADLIVGCGEIPNFQSPVGTDNCAGAVTTQLTGPPIASVLPLPPGVSTFEFEVLDASGERATCTFSVTTQNDWYLDADGDGVGAISEPITQCPAPGPNYVSDKNYDCDDTNAGLQVFLFPDADEDGFGNSLLPICSSQAEADAASAASKKRSPDQVTLLVIGGDCDDTNPDINPNEIELCNGVDDNCNGVVDEGCDPPAAPPSLPTVPVIPLPPEPSLPSEQTIIVIPTPLPPAPPTPQQQIIIVQPAVFSDSGAASLMPSVAALLACVGAVVALLF